jgi:hypothetical protein
MAEPYIECEILFLLPFILSSTIPFKRRVYFGGIFVYVLPFKLLCKDYHIHLPLSSKISIISWNNWNSLKYGFFSILSLFLFTENIPYYVKSSVLGITPIILIYKLHKHDQINKKKYITYFLHDGSYKTGYRRWTRLKYYKLNQKTEKFLRKTKPASIQ